MKFREPYKFEKNDEKEENVLLMEAGEIEEEDISVGEDASTVKEEEVGHELNESLLIINFIFLYEWRIDRVHALSSISSI